MIIIAGTGHPKKEKFISKNTRSCSRCNNSSYWIFEKTKEHVTLFFMPVVPYRTDYKLYCSICGNVFKLDKEDFDTRVATEAKPYQEK